MARDFSLTLIAASQAVVFVEQSQRSEQRISGNHIGKLQQKRARKRVDQVS
jgi:hypothetical protein